MEDIRPSKTLVTTYKTTWHHSPENHNRHLLYRDNLNFQTINFEFFDKCGLSSMIFTINENSSGTYTGTICMHKERKGREICGSDCGEDVELALRIVTPCGIVGRYQCFSLGDGDSMFLRNVGIYTQVQRRFNPQDEHRQTKKLIAVAKPDRSGPGAKYFSRSPSYSITFIIMTCQ
jgi:hypothetical protein